MELMGFLKGEVLGGCWRRQPGMKGGKRTRKPTWLNKLERGAKSKSRRRLHLRVAAAAATATAVPCRVHGVVGVLSSDSARARQEAHGTRRNGLHWSGVCRDESSRVESSRRRGRGEEDMKETKLGWLRGRQRGQRKRGQVNGDSGDSEGGRVK